MKLTQDVAKQFCRVWGACCIFISYVLWYYLSHFLFK